MGRSLAVGAFTFLPRNAEGAPDRCEFLLSEDGRNWTLAADCHFDDLPENPGMRLVKLDTPRRGRFLRFVARHVVNNGDYVVVAGIGVMEAEQ
jgi:hypothetical protein